MKYLVLVLLLVGCARQPNTTNIEPKFTKQYSLFMYYAQLNHFRIDQFKIDNLVIKSVTPFGSSNLGPGFRTIGMCYRDHLNADNTISFLIEIDSDVWDNSRELDRESLLFHELGHCLLDRDHRDGVLSLMNSLAVSGEAFSLQYDAYIKELFSD